MTSLTRPSPHELGTDVPHTRYLLYHPSKGSQRLQQFCLQQFLQRWISQQAQKGGDAVYSIADIGLSALRRSSCRANHS
jgi:hypothetical protein